MLFKFSIAFIIFVFPYPPFVMSKIPLYVGSLFVLTDYWFGKYGGFFPVLFQSAFDEIANRSDILTDYHLFIINKDTKAIPGLGAKRLMEFVNESPPKIAIIGPAMSDEISLVGQITPQFNLLEMNFVSTTSTIKQRDIYSSLYVMNYIEDDLNPLRIAMMKYFQWERVATLIFDNEIYHSQIDEFHDLLQKENFTLLTSGIVRDISQTSEQIRRIKQYDARIIFGAFRSNVAPYIFCEAHKQGLFGKKYVWILAGASMYLNWIANTDESSLPCKKAELYEAANRHFTLSIKRLSDTPNVTVSGKTPKEYSEYVDELISNTGYSLSRTHPWAYDNAWALAIGLNNSLSYLTGGAKLEDFDYNRSDIYTAIKQGMDEVKFEGVSGPVSFLNGRRRGYTYLDINIGDNRTIVAVYDPESEQLTWYTDPLSNFEGRKVPKDRFRYMESQVTVSYVGAICIIILNTFGVFVAIGFLLFNLIFRNNRNIKMSSPRINNIIIIGCIIMYLSVYLDAVDSITPEYRDVQSICMVKVWLLSMGFTTTFSALFSKTWRVHVLFRHNDLRRKSVKDCQLMGMCLLFLIFDFMLLVPWTLIHPLSRELIKVQQEENAYDDDNVIETLVYKRCHHEKQVYWLCVEFISKGVLLAFGTFLAWETRMVTVPALNDSRLIGFCVYNIVIMSAFGVPIQYTVPDERPTVKFVLTSTVIIFCTTLVMCILFVPKLKLRNQTENLKFVSTLNSKTESVITRGTRKSEVEMTSAAVERQPTMVSSKDGEEDEDLLMRAENTRLRMEMARETIAIAKLRKKILVETGDIHFHKVGNEYMVFRVNKKMSECENSKTQMLESHSSFTDIRAKAIDCVHKDYNSVI